MCRLVVGLRVIHVAFVVGKEPTLPPARRSARPGPALDPGTASILRAHRKAQLEERLALGAGYRDGGIVFARIDGTPLHPQYVSDTFERLVRKAGVPPIRLRDCRHTAAIVALDEGVPLKVVSERLCHSSVAITADVYQHVLENMQEDAAARVGAALLGG
jgi:integrase